MYDDSIASNEEPVNTGIPDPNRLLVEYALIDGRTDLTLEEKDALLSELCKKHGVDPGLSLVDITACALRAAFDIPPPPPSAFPAFPEFVDIELSRSYALFPRPFASYHEGLSIIREEVREVKKQVYKNDAKRNPSKLLQELAQVGAMVQRFAEDLGLVEPDRLRGLHEAAEAAEIDDVDEEADEGLRHIEAALDKMAADLGTKTEPAQKRVREMYRRGRKPAP